MASTFCVTIAHCKTDPDKATLGFVVANAAQGSEKETMVFLSSDGIYCAVPGEMVKIDEGAPFAPLKDLVDKFIKAGGKIYVCTPCMKKRGITEADLIQGATPAGDAALVEWLSNGSPAVARTDRFARRRLRLCPVRRTGADRSGDVGGM
jgi:uncharacterized protein